MLQELKAVQGSRAASLAITKLEEAFMWIDYHMKSRGWDVEKGPSEDVDPFQKRKKRKKEVADE